MKNYIVGAIFFLFLGIGFYFTILEKSDDSVKYPYKLKLYASKMEGVKVGDDVQLRGVLYGKIFSINKVRWEEVPTYPPLRFVPDGSKDVVELILAMKKPVTLWDNYQFRFKTKTVFSGRHLDLDPGNPDDSQKEQTHFKPFYTDQDRIPDIAPSLRYYEDVFGEANAMLVENRYNIRKTVIHFKQISEKLSQEKKGTIPRILNSDQLYLHTQDSMTDIAILSREARRYLEGQRELDLIPTTFLMAVVFNLLGLSILGNN
jgi:ABC-type transporter Mla subunit MlaD